jgi:hypothetical protein
MMGEIIYNGNSSIVNNQLLEHIELTEVPGGVYFVKVLVGNSEFTKQLVVQK